MVVAEMSPEAVGYLYLPIYPPHTRQTDGETPPSTTYISGRRAHGLFVFSNGTRSWQTGHISVLCLARYLRGTHMYWYTRR